MSDLNIDKMVEEIKSEKVETATQYWSGYNKGLLKAVQVIREYQANGDNKEQEQALPLNIVRQQSELYVSFARYVGNYGKGSYTTTYEDMFKEWCDKKKL
jgi:subtilase family serine protease